MRITGCRIVLPDTVLDNASMVIENGKIAEILSHSLDNADLDLGGRLLAPGCVDLHTHGSGGFDFMDGDEDAIHGAAGGLAEYGTTSALATTLTSSNEELFTFFDNFEKAKKCRRENEAKLMGVHLEGPYFNFDMKGAQDPRYIRKPEKDDYKEIIRRSHGNIKRWSVAPELEGAMEFIKYVSSSGIIVSGGHTKADFRTIEKAVGNGMTMLTHYYSAMSSMTKNHSWKILGATEAGFYFDELTVELICDGCHLPEDLLKLIFKLKRHDRIIAISDSMRAAGFTGGKSILGPKNNGTDVVVKDGVAYLADFSCFAGSVATGIRLVRTLRTLLGLDWPEIFSFTSLQPAALINEDGRIGSLAPGKDADFMILDDECNLHGVYISGIKVN